MSKEEINAFLGSGTTYQGKLVFQNAVRIDGSFKGEIQSEGSLIIGKEGVIDGTLEVGELILSGLFIGEVRANKKIVVHKTGKIQGSLVSPALVAEEGAVINGQVTMQSPLVENNEAK